MVLYYNTNEFADIVEDVGAQVDANKLTSDTIAAYVKGKYNLEKEEYNNAINEAEKAEKEWHKYKEEFGKSPWGLMGTSHLIPAHLREQEEGTFDAIVGFPKKAILSGLREGTKGLVQLGGMAIEGVAGEEITEDISDKFSELDKILSENPWTKPFVESFKETFDPKTTTAEDVTGFIASLGLGTAGAATTIMKVAPKVPGYLSRIGGFVTADLVLTDKNENLARHLIEGVPEEERNVLQKALEVLAVDENDPNSIKILKKAIESTAIGGAGEALIWGIIKGYRTIKGKIKSVKEDDILNPPKDNTGEIKKVEVVKQPDDTFKHKTTLETVLEFPTQKKMEFGKVKTPIRGAGDPETAELPGRIGWWLGSRGGFDKRTNRALEAELQARGSYDLLSIQKAKEFMQSVEKGYSQKYGKKIKYKDLKDSDFEDINIALGQLPILDENLPKNIAAILNKASNKKTEKDLELINDFFDSQYGIARKAKDEALAKLPPEVRQSVKELRVIVDDFSQDLINTGITNKYTAISMSKKKGLYLTTEYEIFTNPNWVKAVKKALKTGKGDVEALKAIEGVRQYIRRGNPGIKKDQENLHMEMFFDNLVGDDTIDLVNLLRTGVTASRKDHPLATQIFKPKEVIPSELRTLFKEVKDPAEKFINTISKQSQMLTKHQFLKNIEQIAKDQGYAHKVYSLEKKEGFAHSLEDLAGNYLKKYKDGSNPLAKVFVSKKFKEQLTTGIDINSSPHWFLKELHRANSLAGAQQTILSEATHLVNLQGNVVFSMANGNLVPITFRGFKSTGDAVKGLYKASPNLQRSMGKLINTDNKGQVKVSTEELRKLHHLGLIDSGVNAEFFIKSFDLAFNPKKANKYTRNLLIRPYKFFGKIYRNEDAIFKVFNYYKEVEKYRKAFPNFSPDELSTYAAEIVKDTFPTYYKIPRALKLTRAVPLGTAFPSFFVESLRATKNVWKIGGRDFLQGLATGNTELIKIGASRLGGAVAAGYLGDYFWTDNNKQRGVEPEDDKVAETLMPPFEKRNVRAWSTPIIMKKNGDIEGSYFNISRTDPYTASRQFAKIFAESSLSAPIEDMTVSKWEKWVENTAIDVVRTASPIFTESLIMAPIVDIIRGNVFIPEKATMFETAKAYAAHVAKSWAMPRTWRDINKTIDAYESEEARGKGEGQSLSGFPDRPENRLWRFLGQTRNTFNFNKSLQSKAGNISRSISKINGNLGTFLTRQANKGIKLDDPEVAQEFYEELDNYIARSYEAQADMAELLHNVQRLHYYVKSGDKIKNRRVDARLIMSILSSKGMKKFDDKFNTAMAQRAMNKKGMFKAPSIGDDKFRDLMQRRGLGRHVREISAYLMQHDGTPLLNIEEE